MPTRPELARVLDALERFHGRPDPPPTTDPLELVLWENVAYLAVQEAIAPQLEPDQDWLIRAHLLMRRHGQTLCRRNRPRCEACPLAEGCVFYRTARGSD